MKKALMYGAGNIGRGFIGQLFSSSGYEVVFVDINDVVIDRLNKDGKYPVRIARYERYDEVVVNNVRGVNGNNKDLVYAEIAFADIMATAVGVNVLPHIAPVIAGGLKERKKRGITAPLNIIVCENLIDADKYLAELIRSHLDEDEKMFFNKNVGLVEASIGRMVPVMTEEMQEGNPLRVYVEEYDMLPLDKSAFKGEIPEIKNMIPYAPFDLYIRRKLYMHNMGHATVAYLGALKGYEYIWQSIEDPWIKIIALRALTESAIGLSREYGHPLEELMDHAHDLIKRFGNRLLGDTVERVGKDPVRKLAKGDRLEGAIDLCRKNGIYPAYICAGMAAGYAFNNLNDKASLKVTEFTEKEGLKKAVAKFSSMNDEDQIVELISSIYEMIKKNQSYMEIEKELRFKSKMTMIQHT